jgi:1-deoxy-D-xylulose-5-phosphate reductoisomerase
MKKRVAVLGATGSIGKSSLDVLSRGRENFDVVLLAARSDSKGLEKAAAGWPEARCVLAAGDSGRQELLDAIEDARADIVINGISGSAGLEPSIKALNGGTLALANKETVVMAGPLVLKLAREKETKIIPVDSEHSAIFHLIQAHGVPEEIFLTASGGPFLNSSTEEMEKATVEAAVAHPTWKMGPKISVDSASMANKGLEVIEAAFFLTCRLKK